MMSKSNMVVAAMLMLAGCAQERRPQFWSPVGQWVGTGNLRIEVNEDSTYEVCYLSECEAGVARFVFQGSGVNLLDFYEKRPVVTFINNYDASVRSDADILQIAGGKMPEEMEEDLCGESICVRTGMSIAGQSHLLFRR